MSYILPLKNYAVYLIPFIAVVSVTSSCSANATTPEENKSKVVYFLDEVVGRGNENAVNELLAPDCKYYDAGRIKTAGVQEFIDYLRRARKPYASIEIEVHNLVAEGNWVAVRYTYHSTVEGETIIVPAMADFLIEDGKITEMWRYIPALRK